MELTQEQLTAELSAVKADLEQLKATHGEVLTKSQSRKSKISELEAANTALSRDVSTLKSSLRQVTIDGPVRQMSESISTAPELFQEQLSKHFKVELIDGKLALLSTDGKPVLSKDGKLVPFEAKALTEFLVTGDDARAKAFRAITVTSRASGAASTTRRVQLSETKPSVVKFGLR